MKRLFACLLFVTGFSVASMAQTTTPAKKDVAKTHMNAPVKKDMKTNAQAAKTEANAKASANDSKALIATAKQATPSTSAMKKNAATHKHYVAHKKMHTDSKPATVVKKDLKKQ